MLTTNFAVQLLSEHLFYWKKPKKQKAIIIVILMAPIYSIGSFVGSLDFQGSKALFMYLDSIKECYEALVIFQYLKSFLKYSSSRFWYLFLPRVFMIWGILPPLPVPGGFRQCWKQSGYVFLASWWCKPMVSKLLQREVRNQKVLVLL